MQYLLMLYVDEAGWPRLTPEEQRRGMAAYMAYTQALTEAGVLRGLGRLRPTAEAATVRLGAGGAEVLDGPYAETKEQMGGYFLIEVPDRAAALDWAERCPAAGHGIVEVRPLWPAPG